jgi:pimeloyl-ACP methyl ester carboxylesterase
MAVVVPVPKPHASRDGSHLHAGCRFSYQIRGEGPPVIFIQGLSIHGGAWAPQIDALAAHYECLSFDNRGVGRSQPLGARLTIEQMAADTFALMDAENWPSAHLVGQSLGGLIALQMALSARHRMRSLSLLCSFPRGRDVHSGSTRYALRLAPHADRHEASTPESLARNRDARVGFGGGRL